MANSNLPIPGRLYDVLLLQASDYTVSGVRTTDLLSPAGIVTVGSAITGILKLVQRVVLEFLTIKGSMLFAANRGCGFMSAIAQGLIQTDIDIYHQFAFASNTVLANLTLDATSTDPPDEILDTLALTGYDLEPGYLSLRISITSMAGTSASIILPIPTSP